MKLGIMQPYFFPYIGYWQLMNAVDTYVIYDDVTFIKNGWINRNRILLDGKAHYFNLPTIGAGSYVLIKDIKLNHNKKLFLKLLKNIESAYRKAPEYTTIMPLLEKIILYSGENMIDLLTFQIREIARFFDMNTNILISSRDIAKDNTLHGQDKLLDICRNLSASEYYNSIGGQELYSKEIFMQAGIKISFLQTNEIEYQQFNNEFIPYLSIIDVMMFCNKYDIKNKLLKYELK